MTSVKSFHCLGSGFRVVVGVEHKRMPEELPNYMGVTWLRTG